MSYTRKHHCNGFTLVEIMLYIALTLTILIAIVQFFLAGLEAYGQQKLTITTDEETSFMTQTIESYLTNATSVTSPAAGATERELVLSMADAEVDPVVISLSEGTAYIQRGNHDPEPLHASTLYVEDMIFSNLANEGGKPSIRIEIMANNPSFISIDALKYAQVYTTAYTKR